MSASLQDIQGFSSVSCAKTSKKPSSFLTRRYEPGAALRNSLLYLKDPVRDAAWRKSEVAGALKAEGRGDGRKFLITRKERLVFLYLYQENIAYMGQSL